MLDLLLLALVYSTGIEQIDYSGNSKGGSITVPLASCLTGLEQSVLKIKTKIVSRHTADSKPVKQQVNGTVILPPLVFPGLLLYCFCQKVIIYLSTTLRRCEPTCFMLNGWVKKVFQHNISALAKESIDSLACLGIS